MKFCGNITALSPGDISSYTSGGSPSLVIGGVCDGVIVGLSNESARAIVRELQRHIEADRACECKSAYAEVGGEAGGA